ncbi:hypothetical protein F5Y19DRAFT_72620 [Xylariaceae sp. FL1651]|nr:hypothetical protein F5Y19DRAFT_72620 [Xylariaceae sp. FL1651]
MASTRHSQGAMREVLRSRYEDQDFIVSRAQRTPADISDLRSLDVNISMRHPSVHREKKYKPSQGFSYPSSREQVESISERAGFPTSQRAHEKTVRFDDEYSLDGRPLEGLGREVRRRGDLPRVSEGYLVGGSGNGNGKVRYRAGHNSALPKKYLAGEKERSYFPTAPIIPRLPTPELDLMEPYEIPLDKHKFCACCASVDKDEEEELNWRKGKFKMDKQVDDAKAYISQKVMGGRAIAEA